MVALNGRPALLSLRLIGAVLKLRLAACLTRFESGRVRLMARLKKPGTDHRPCPLLCRLLGDFVAKVVLHWGPKILRAVGAVFV